MNTITPQTPPNSRPHLQRSRWERLFCSFSRFGLILFAVVALAATARATIVGVADCTCTNLTIEVTGFPDVPAGTLTAALGGVAVDGTFDFATQRMVLIRPADLAGGTYLLEIFQNQVLFANKEITVCACPCPCPGPPGPAGTPGLRGPRGLSIPVWWKAGTSGASRTKRR